jgi:multidrug efflux pump subunit AcrA (membrane-fusion protein)
MTHQKSTGPTRSSPGRPATLFRTVILAGLALAGSAALTQYVRSQIPEQFSGELQARSVEVTASVNGVVDQVSVKPGQIVYPDDALFVIDNLDHADRIASAQSEVDRLAADLRIAQAEYELELHQILGDMETVVHDIRDDLAQLEGDRFQLSFRDTAFSDFLGHLDNPVASTDPMDLMRLLRDAPGPAMQLGVMIERGRIENDLDTKQARINLSESRLSRLQAEQEQLPDKLHAALGLPAMEEQLANVRGRVSELQYTESTQVVSSPIYGMAGLVQVDVSDAVQQGYTLLRIFDRSHESVQVELPSRLAPELSVDREVSLTFPGGELRSGRIEAIPPQATRPANVDGESQIAVTIRPAGRVWPTLPIGTTVSVSLGSSS